MSSYVSQFTRYLSSDVVFILLLLVILTGLVIYFGKARVVALILAFYPATLLYKTFPFVDNVVVLKGDNLLLLNRVGLFLVFLIPIYVVAGRYVSHYGEYTGVQGVIRNAGFSVALLILLALFSYTTVNLDSIHNFGPQIDALFSGTDRIFWWSLAPLVLLGFL